MTAYSRILLTVLSVALVAWLALSMTWSSARAGNGGPMLPPIFKVGASVANPVFGVDMKDVQKRPIPLKIEEVFGTWIRVTKRTGDQVWISVPSNPGEWRVVTSP